VAAVMATVVTEVAILRDPPGSLRWWQPLLILGGIAAAVSLWVAIRPMARALVAAGAIGLLLVAPAVWAAETIPHVTGSTFPYGGPAIMAARHGISGPALTARSLKGRRARRRAAGGALSEALAYARHHGGGIAEDGAAACQRQQERDEEEGEEAGHDVTPEGESFGPITAANGRGRLSESRFSKPRRRLPGREG